MQLVTTNGFKIPRVRDFRELRVLYFVYSFLEAGLFLEMLYTVMGR